MILTKRIVENLKANISNVLIQDFKWQLEEIKLIGSGVINAVYFIHLVCS